MELFLKKIKLTCKILLLKQQNCLGPVRNLDTFLIKKPDSTYIKCNGKMHWDGNLVVWYHTMVIEITKILAIIFSPLVLYFIKIFSSLKAI